MTDQLKTFAHPIAEGLCLYGIKVTGDEVVAPPQPVRQKQHHVIIFDRSGSMTHLLKEVCDDLAKMVDIIEPQDTLTLGWFSTQGQYNWIVKGVTVGGNEKAIKEAINKHRNSVYLTCFSDILTDTAEHVVDDLKNFGGALTFTFMTDGYPVVSDYNTEVKKTMAALKKIGAEISSVLFIGYGDYYNKELMLKMAEQSGGILAHASHLIDFEQATYSMVTGVAPASKIPVQLPGPMITVFTISKDGVASVPVEDGVAMVPDGTEWLWALSEKVVTGVAYTGLGDVPGMDLDRPLLGAAYLEVAATRTDRAMVILNAVGDVRLMKSVINSWTNAEYGKAQGEIKEAMNNPAVRFLDGKNHNFIPDPNAFCLVDALNLLMNDNRAFFYPLRPEFQYKRTGVATFTADGYPKFEADESTSCQFNKLVWNKSRLNLGVLTTIPGSVELGDDAMDHGLPSVLKTMKWRNYTIVKDGILNTTTIPVSMSRETFDVLQANGMIASSFKWLALGIFPVRLDVVPIVNQRMANPITAEKYCSLLNEELTHEFRIKYLKYWLDKVSPDHAIQESKFDSDQVEYLKTKGINAKGEYAPPVVKGEANDYYFGREFDVKIKGFSSVPKISDVADKALSRKPYTVSEQKMADIIAEYDRNLVMAGATNAAAKESWIATQLDVEKDELAKVRNILQETRFGILLCKKWFSDLNDRDGAVVNLNGQQYTFSIKEVKVEY